MLTLEELHAHYVNKIGQDTFDYSDWNKLVVDYRTDVVAYLARFITLFRVFSNFQTTNFKRRRVCNPSSKHCYLRN